MNRTQWLRKYPKHCKSCEARTNSSYPCRGCLLDGNKCPRCMKSGTLHEYDASIPCTSCGWVETEDDIHGAPLSRKDIKRLREEAEETDEQDRFRRISEARQTLKELGES